MIVLGFSGIANGTYWQERHGLQFVGHDAAVALIIDGRVVFAAEEERFNREKHTSKLPVRALQAALSHAGIEPRDIDRLAYTWRVTPLKFLNMCVHHAPRVPPRHAFAMAAAGVRVMRDLMSPRVVARDFEAAFGRALPEVTGVEHHLGHAATAYLPSPFDHAAVLTIDGQGEDESASLGEWEGSRYRRIGSIRSPNSIGILYGMVTDFLGMRAGWDEYKVMAMAAEGDPSRFERHFGELVQLKENGQYSTRRTAMVFQPGYCERMLGQVFDVAARKAGEPLEQVHFDLAAALQAKTETVVFDLLKHLRTRTTAQNLCMAGGVALNSVINGRVLASQLFERVWIPPVPGDHGGALGAALLVHQRLTNGERRTAEFSPFLGSDLDPDDIRTALAERSSELVVETPPNLVERVAALLALEKLVACCRGRMEYGPRALGHRSLLASPIHASMRERINARVKHRELFRPFAAMVPLERAHEIFELDIESPFMQFVVPLRPPWRSRFAATEHHGRTRVQTVTRASDPFVHELLHEFGRRTGVPGLLNTSFNDADEPMICSAREAVSSFLSSQIDALVLGDCLVSRAPLADHPG